MEKRLQELVNRKPSKWGNVTVKEFNRDIQMLQNAVKERGIEKDYAFLYLRENIVRLETRLQYDHLLPHMRDSINLELSALKKDLASMEHLTGVST